MTMPLARGFELEEEGEDPVALPTFIKRIRPILKRWRSLLYLL